MNLEEIKKEVLKFQKERDWEKFHDPKNLAESISVESGELLELFLWKDKQQVLEEIKNNNKYKQEIVDELADVFLNCFQMANTLDLNIEKIFFNKLEKIKKNYPINKAKGVAIKYNKL
jgi:NTP pyrophosphatase (non-canonical NTP hydrolase)